MTSGYASTRRPGRRTWVALGIACAVVLLVCCGGGVIGLVALGTSARVPAEKGDPQPRPAPSPTRAVDLSSRATDPRPLTVRDVFPGTAIVTGGRTYRILRAEALPRCVPGAYGRTAVAVRAQGCTQLVRATVLDPTGRYLATVGIANLGDAVGAERVAASQHEPDRGSFTPLAVPGTAASTFRRTNGGIVAGRAQGHYAVYCWVGLRTGRDPALPDGRIDRMIHDLCDAAATALDRRAAGE